MAQEAGELSIIGKVEDSEIDTAFDQWERDFNDLENQTNQVNATMKKMSDTTDTLAKHFMTIATVGVAGITALSTKSPALAGTFAQIELSTLKLSNTVGKQVKPVFEGVNSLLRDFDQALIGNDESISNFAGSLGESMGDVGSIITAQWGKIDNLVPKTGGALLGIKLGARFGLPGMILGAALGAAAGDLSAGEAPTPELEEKYGAFADTANVLQNVKSDLTDQALSDMNVFEEGAAFFQMGHKRSKQFALNLVADSIEWAWKALSGKETKLSTADGVPREE